MGSVKLPIRTVLHWIVIITLSVPAFVGFSVVISFTEPLRQLMYIGFTTILCTAVLFASFRSGDRIKLGTPDGLLVLFLFLMAISWIGNPVTYASLEPFALWINGLILYFCLRVIYRETDLARCIESILLIFTVFLVCSYLLETYTRIWQKLLWPVEPFDTDFNSYATLLIPGIFISLARISRPGNVLLKGLYLVMVAVLLQMLVSTSSRAVYLGLAVSAIFIILFRARNDGSAFTSRILFSGVDLNRLCIIVLAFFWLLLLVFLVTLPEWIHLISDHVGESIGGRLRRWANGIMMARDHFVSGIGVGNWSDMFPIYRHSAISDPGGYDLAFNTAVEYFAEGGILLYSSFAVLTGYAISKGSFQGRSLMFKGMLLCLLVTCLFHISFWSNSIVLIWVLVLLALAGESSELARNTGRGASVRTLSILCLGLCLPVFGYQFVAAAALAKNASIMNHLQYRDGKMFFSFENDLSTLPEKAGLYLKNVDYRSMLPEDYPEGMFATRTTRKVYSVIGSKEQRRDDCESAKRWYAAALNRFEFDLNAKSGLCACALKEEEYDSVIRICSDALALSDNSSELHKMIGTAYHEKSEWQAALEHFLRARELLRQGIGEHEFGLASTTRITDRVNSLQLIDERINRIHETTGKSRDPAFRRERISGVAEVHKSLAAYRGKVLFSSNQSGKYNLWEIPFAGGMPQMLTNDPLSPFRLSASDSRSEVYFVADEDGNYRYSLYKVNPFTGVRQKLVPESDLTSVAEYALSPNGRYIVYKEETEKGDQVFLLNTASLERRKIDVLPVPVSHLVWNHQSDRFAFVSGRRIIGLYSVKDSRLLQRFASLPGFISNLDFAPETGNLYVLESAPRKPPVLWYLDTATRKMTAINTGGRNLKSVYVVDENRLFVTEFVDDMYLHSELNIADHSWRPVGEQTGVSYQIAFDRFSDFAFYLHSGKNTPLELRSLNTQTLEVTTIRKFSDISAGDAFSYKRKILGGPDGSVPYYLYSGNAGRNAPIIVWLHGTNSSFSPRWHKYAQFFSEAGYLFTALNFSGSTGQERQDLSYEELRLLQARQVNQMVEEIRISGDYENSPVVAVGVSYGSVLAGFISKQNPDLFDAVVEYSPVKDVSVYPLSLPVYTFTGAHDAYANTEKIIAAHDVSSKYRKLTVYPNEGHDLRYMDNISDRLEKTLKFIDDFFPVR